MTFFALEINNRKQREAIVLKIEIDVQLGHVTKNTRTLQLG